MTKSELASYAKEKQILSEAVYAIRSTIYDLEEKASRIRADIMADVTGDKGADGKPLYSNEQARKAEAQRREDASEDLQETRKSLRKLFSDVNERESKIGYYNDIIRIGCAFAAVPELA